MKFHPAVKSKLLFLFSCIALFSMAGCVSTAPSYKMPASIDHSARYLFFLHGTITETNGAYATHPYHGTYDYYKMVKSFSDQGFTIISEVRPRGTGIERYARKITRQVKDLLVRGVSPQNISVVGFSKGGAITLYVSSMLKNPEVNFVVLAGCGASGNYRKGFEKFLKSGACDLRGRILSVYDTTDAIGGSCKEAFDLSTGKISRKEIKLNVGKGHGTFYQPRDEWLIPVVEWIKEAK